MENNVETTEMDTMERFNRITDVMINDPVQKEINEHRSIKEILEYLLGEDGTSAAIELFRGHYTVKDISSVSIFCINPELTDILARITCGIESRLDEVEAEIMK